MRFQYVFTCPDLKLGDLDDADTICDLEHRRASGASSCDVRADSRMARAVWCEVAGEGKAKSPRAVVERLRARWKLATWRGEPVAVRSLGWSHCWAAIGLAHYELFVW